MEKYLFLLAKMRQTRLDFIIKLNMNIELSNTQELRNQLASIDSFTKYLSEVAEESPERVYIFANRLKKALDLLEKNTKDRAIIHQETYGELGA